MVRIIKTYKQAQHSQETICYYLLSMSQQSQIVFVTIESFWILKFGRGCVSQHNRLDCNCSQTVEWCLLNESVKDEWLRNKRVNMCNGAGINHSAAPWCFIFSQNMLSWSAGGSYNSSFFLNEAPDREFRNKPRLSHCISYFGTTISGEFVYHEGPATRWWSLACVVRGLGVESGRHGRKKNWLAQALLHRLLFVCAGG